MEITFNVNINDIKGGVCSDAKRCAVANALNRVVRWPITGVEVTGGHVLLLTGFNVKYTARVSQELANYIAQFDTEWFWCNPKTFTLDFQPVST